METKSVLANREATLWLVQLNNGIFYQQTQPLPTALPEQLRSHQ
jgi:hypothetical protein